MVSLPDDRSPLRIAVNATAYEASVPSGARNRAVGLCAALLRSGVHLDVFSSPDLDLGSLVEDELNEPLPPGAWTEQATDLDPKRPLARALSGPRWAQAHLEPTRHHLFLTDYYPVASSVPTALSVHDLRYFGGRTRGAVKRQIWFRTFYPRIARRALLLLTLTEAVADEVVKVLGVPRERVVVVPASVPRVYREAIPVSGPGHHLLAVGMGDTRKGADILCKACRVAIALGSVLPIVMTGRRTPYLDDLLIKYRDLVDNGHLQFEGVVSDEKLVSLYRDAAALMHPSTYEGFGIPVLEALSLGVPVCAARDPAVQEVAGAAATYIDADIGAWAQAMRSFSDPATAQARPCTQGLARAQDGSWDVGAQRLVSAFDAVVRHNSTTQT